MKLKFNLHWSCRIGQIIIYHHGVETHVDVSLNIKKSDLQFWFGFMYDHLKHVLGLVQNCQKIIGNMRPSGMFVVGGYVGQSD